MELRGKKRKLKKWFDCACRHDRLVYSSLLNFILTAVFKLNFYFIFVVLTGIYLFNLISLQAKTSQKEE
jgi:hypothetical protein